MSVPSLSAPVSREGIEAALSFLPRLEALIPDLIWSKKPQVSIHHQEIWLERGEYNPVIEQFQQALYDHALIRDFNWMGWQSRAARILENPDLLRSARLMTCVKLLTLHIRRERFCDGHLAEMIREMHISAILRRMAELVPLAADSRAFCVTGAMRRKR